MSTIKDIARNYADEIRDGIAWVAVWKTGRSWNARAFWLDCGTDKFDPDDFPEVLEILESDPAAVLLNGYYCGQLGEDMSVGEIASGFCWHYENGYNRLIDSAALTLTSVSEQPEETKANQSTELTIQERITGMTGAAGSGSPARRQTPGNCQTRKRRAGYDGEFYKRQ